MTNGVGDGVEAPAIINPSSGVKFLEVQGRIIQELLSFGVSRNENLKPAVKNEAVDVVGTDAAADAVGSLEDDERNTFGLEPSGSS